MLYVIHSHFTTRYYFAKWLLFNMIGLCPSDTVLFVSSVCTLSFKVCIISSISLRLALEHNKYTQSQGFAVLEYTERTVHLCHISIIYIYKLIWYILMFLLCDSKSKYCIMIVSSITVTFSRVEQVVFSLKIIIWEAARREGG